MAGGKQMFRQFLSNKSGATAIEYGLIAALISLAIFAGVGSSGAKLGILWDETATKVVDGLRPEE